MSSSMSAVLYLLAGGAVLLIAAIAVPRIAAALGQLFAPIWAALGVKTGGSGEEEPGGDAPVDSSSDWWTKVLGIMSATWQRWVGVW